MPRGAFRGPDGRANRGGIWQKRLKELSVFQQLSKKVTVAMSRHWTYFVVHRREDPKIRKLPYVNCWIVFTAPEMFSVMKVIVDCSIARQPSSQKNTMNEDL
jgi:hypothetical protein